MEVGIQTFGTDNHTLLLTVVDVYGQIFSREFGFRLIERKFTVMIQYKVDQVVFMICSSGATDTATNSNSISYSSR